jgi:hypothetical protein
MQTVPISLAGRARWQWVAGCAWMALGLGTALAGDWFVATNGADAAAGTNWATAKLTIQAGVDAAADGDTIWVSNGVYATGGRAVAGTWTNRVAIDKPLTVQSVHGPEATVITGGLVRCAYLTNGAVLSGFTLTGGESARGATMSLYAALLYGGGAWCEPEGVLTNCILRGNWAIWGGGGARGGRLDNCLLIENQTDRAGGGTYQSVVTHSIYSNNVAIARAWTGAVDRREPRDIELRDGGAAYGGMLSHCVLQNNTSYGHGGATYAAALDFCTVKDNWAPDGSAAYTGSLSNCVITGNTGDGSAVLFECTLDNCLVAGNHNDKGVIISCVLNNCTVVNNTAYEYSGGVRNCALTNCIVYGNSAGGFPAAIISTAPLPIPARRRIRAGRGTSRPIRSWWMRGAGIAGWRQDHRASMRETTPMWRAPWIWTGIRASWGGRWIWGHMS